MVIGKVVIHDISMADFKDIVDFMNRKNIDCEVEAYEKHTDDCVYLKSILDTNREIERC